MSTHALYFACNADVSGAFIGGLNSYLSVWLTNYTAWEPDGDLTQDNTEPETTINTEPDGTGTEYWQCGFYRFDWSQDKSIILDNLSGQADVYCDWYWLGWHECDHDETSRTGCVPDETVRTSGTIPTSDVLPGGVTL